MKQPTAKLTVTPLSPSAQPALKPDGPDDSKAKVVQPATQPTQLDPTDDQLDPILFIDGDKVQLNLPALAAKYAESTPAAFSDLHSAHFVYSEAEGIWIKQTRKEAAWKVSEFIKAIALERNLPVLLTKRTSAMLNGVLQLVEGHAPIDLSLDPERKVLPVADGALDLSGETAVLRPFRKEDRFTTKLPWRYDPKAKCERFLKELIGPSLADPDDVDLLQRDLGRHLIGGNHAQTISVLTGLGGSGKSVLVSIHERMIGIEKVAYLRPDKLTGRFETHGFHGKTLVVGKDVRGNYLDNAGAAMIKSLTGSDLIESEKKYGGKYTLRGNLHVVITSNSRLPIKLEGDASAWRRRLVCYEFSREAPQQPVPNFDAVLLQEEGVGIFAWLIEGYFAHQRELKKHGKLKLTTQQQARVDNWIMESDAEREFARLHIVKKDASTLTVEEIWQRFAEFAVQCKWRIPPKQKFCTKLPEVMLELFGVERENHIMRLRTAVRGYRGVGFSDATDLTVNSKEANS